MKEPAPKCTIACADQSNLFNTDPAFRVQEIQGVCKETP